MNKGVAVTGLGIISSIGDNMDENLYSLHSKKNGITAPQILRTSHTNLPVGEIKYTNEQLAEKMGLNSQNTYTRASLLGILAIQELQRNYTTGKFLSDTGLISGTSVGGIDMTERFYFDFKKNKNLSNYIQAQHPGFTTETMAAHFNINSFVTTISTACSSAANAIMQGARLIESGILKRVIVGGTDCLTLFTLNGFNSLKILSTSKSKAFDEERDGLNLGEGAAYLMLEAEDDLNGREVLARLSGYGNANDAFHQTASSKNGEGAYLAMQEALKKAEVSHENINYINAHGTGTVNNDLAEGVALQRIFGEYLPNLSSTKGFTGHTLAAAGALEAVFSIFAINNNIVFPCLNFEKAMKETGIIPVVDLKQEKINTVLSNSFGFGGNCTSLIFSKDG